VVRPTSTETRARAADGAGAFAVIEIVLAAESDGPPLHVNRSLDETFYVLEGRASFRVGEVLFTALPGASVFVPRGTSHTYANPSGQRTRVLVVCRASHQDSHECRIVGDPLDLQARGASTASSRSRLSAGHSSFRS
jgi:mannose-6-phosphate isomerase-like protein (cupin superfamily)